MRLEPFDRDGEQWFMFQPYGPDSISLPLSLRELRTFYTVATPLLENIHNAQAQRREWEQEVE